MAQLQDPIIIFGTGRCGSSILSEIVFRHPDLAYPSNYHEIFRGRKEVSLIRHLFDNRWNKKWDQNSKMERKRRTQFELSAR